MRVLLTGAAGFLGSRAAAKFAGHEVHGIDRPGVDTSRLSALAPDTVLHELDMSDAAMLRAVVEEVRPELFVHLAWCATPGTYLTSLENIEHLKAAVDLPALLHPVGCRRLVTAGTCFEYDTSLGLLSEASPTAPKHLYSSCKLAMYEVLRQASRAASLSYCHLRFFYQYGPWEAPGRLVPAIVAALLRGEEAKATAGDQVRDYLHVDDVGSAIASAASSDLEGVVNVGSGIPVRVRDLVLAAARACGREDLVRLGAIEAREGDPPFICADIARLRSTGWRPRFSLDAGLADTIAWARNKS